MTARLRMAVLLLAALLLVGAALAWLQWPLGARDSVVEEAGAVDRQARLDALRTEIEREAKRLEAAREQQARTEEEIRKLEESLEQSRDRIEELQREIGAVDGA